MKAVLFGVGGVIAVIGLGIFGYQMIFDAPADSMVPTDRVTVPEVEVAESVESVVGEGSLLSLLTQALPLECMITYTDETGKDLSGTYFVAGGKVRGDFLVDVQGTDSVASIIIANDTFYSWSEIEGEVYGMKASLSAVTETSDESPEVNSPVALDETVRYDCKPWIAVDGSVFVPPSDVLFQDFSTLMNRGMETPTTFTTTGVDQCALCAMVPAGDGQDECRRAFACE